ncbi:phytoene/squalene synthase family protein [Fulvimarina sp. 2208YS6-2-32]|uniref:Phytoene/squalene synthase family protein n=1 Tax=Fulvimarina uroteuthidis TaxID=3098149 RepID=A0ABU5HZ55_9HYPH|nr:phytoene/squalene synthase family protein [Fulvimarina sp. 2208YS6-2-32]MDY8108404.1 phytoene/squalene synthase family protein [Fulvimarina sp. 2208YS6-2-32]
MSLSESLDAKIVGSLPFGTCERAKIAAEAQATIAKGSKSFAAAARLFDRDTRASAMMLYAWCRHCDDVVDDQILGFRQKGRISDLSAEERLRELETKTLAAINGSRTGEAAFDAIGDVALRHDLPDALVIAHLEGFRMDVDGRVYETIEDTLDYCYCVAGVVGVMMARVMGVRPGGFGGEAVTRTLDRACDLGMGFQLTNIARDIVEDAEAGRVYVPAEWLRDLGLDRRDLHLARNRKAAAELAFRLIDLAEPYYASASHGLAALPPRAAWAVATALGVYRDIGMVIRKRREAAWDDRASTGAAAKFAHAARGAGRTLGSRVFKGGHGRPDDLWTRPRFAALGDASDR